MPKNTLPRSWRAAAPKNSQIQPPALPEWLIETPMDTDYALCMDEGGLDAQECQRVNMTRKEFLTLKVYLAKLRGVRVPVEQPEGTKAGGGTLSAIWNELEPGEIAAVPEASNAR